MLRSAMCFAQVAGLVASKIARSRFSVTQKKLNDVAGRVLT